MCSRRAIVSLIIYYVGFVLVGDLAGYLYALELGIRTPTHGYAAKREAAMTAFAKS
jgi:hypothetical protein